MPYPMQFVRPDFVTRTSVLQPTAQGYQPDEAAQNVATQFTRIYGPTVWDWKERKGAGVMGLGRMAAGLYTDPMMRPHGLVYTRQGPMQVTGGVAASSNQQAVQAIANAFARGQSVRIRDHRGHVSVAHPGTKAKKHTFFSRVINKAKGVIDKATKKAAKAQKKANGNGAAFVRSTAMAPTVPARPVQISPAERAVPQAGIAIVRRHTRPRFNRQAAAAKQILKTIPSALPQPNLWLPSYPGALREDPRAANAAARLATQLTRGPQSVTRPAVANAMDAFRNTGRYF